jgi:hypothetical protein
MKKMIVRSLSLTIVLAGLAATCHTQPNRAQAILRGGAVPSNMPIPVCPPDDPNACGIDK